MSKNFENEYIALTQVEVPDLWDRIEAGLTLKSTQDSENVEASVIDFEKERDSRKEFEDNDKTEKSLISFVKRYKTVLVAAICVIVILPAAVMIGQLGMGGAKSESAADSAPAEMEYAAVTEAAAEEMAEMEETVMEETAMEETVMEATAAGEIMEEAEPAADEAVETSSVYEMYEEASDGAQMSVEAAKGASDECGKEMTEKTDDAEMKEAVNSMANMTEESAEEERAIVVDKLDVEDGTILTHVTMRVLAKEEVNSDGESKGLGNLYRAEVISDADGMLEQGDVILVYLSPLSSLYLPDKEETYDVMLEYDGTREYPFWLKSCY